MSISKFEDLIAWQKAQDVAVLIYELFSDHRDFGFKNQICRAAVSISNNISEGFGSKGQKEFVQFLHIALGASSEVKSMVYLAERLEYIDQNQKGKILDVVDETNKLIYGPIKSIRK
jgi:four helix bundle protein